MAYTFDKVSAQMDEGEKKKNIFGDEAAPGFGLTGTGATDTTKGGAVAKGGSTAIKGPTQGATTTTAQAPAVSEVQQPRGATEARQKALDEAAESAPLPPSLQKLGTGLETRSADLEAAEEAYLDPFRQQDFGLDTKTIQRATTGDEDAYAQVTGLFTQGMPDIPEGFQAPDVMTPGIQDIQTPGGLEMYLRRQAGPTYTAGEAGFDVSALARSPEFQQAAADLASREAALQRQADELQLDLPGQAQDILTGSLTGAQEAARGHLGTLQTNLDQQLLDAIAAKEADIAGMATPGMMQDYATAARGELADLTPDDQGLDELILAGDYDISPSEFFSLPEDPGITRGMVATPEQIAQYNTIQDLLGTGGEALMAEQMPEFGQFDTQGYQDALMDAVRADIEQQQAVQAVKDKALGGGYLEDLAAEPTGGVEDPIIPLPTAPGALGSGATVASQGGIPDQHTIEQAAAAGLGYAPPASEPELPVQADPTLIADPAGLEALGSMIGADMPTPAPTPPPVQADPSLIADPVGMQALGSMIGAPMPAPTPEPAPAPEPLSEYDELKRLGIEPDPPAPPPPPPRDVAVEAAAGDAAQGLNVGGLDALTPTPTTDPVNVATTGYDPWLQNLLQELGVI